ncbi:MAG: hypothetical protein KF878_07370 [Planctomycetes bacterium]|nr:hypothetical protein [Planctomycetota bacterium]
MTRARWLLPLLLLAPGCSAFRAQVGTGFGLGADVQAFGLVHAGALIGFYAEYGPNYGRPPEAGTDYIVLGPVHIAGSHKCFGVLPALFSSGSLADQVALELGLALGPLSFRLGVNPATVGRDVAPAPAPSPSPRQGEPADLELQVRFVDVYGGPTSPERVADTAFDLPEGLAIATRSEDVLALFGAGMTLVMVMEVQHPEGTRLTGDRLEELGRAFFFDEQRAGRKYSAARLVQPPVDLPVATADAREVAWSATDQDGVERVLWVGGVYVGRRGLIAQAEPPASLADEVLPRARRILTSARVGGAGASAGTSAAARPGTSAGAPGRPTPAPRPSSGPERRGLDGLYDGPALRRALPDGFSAELPPGWRLDLPRHGKVSAWSADRAHEIVFNTGEVRAGITSADLVQNTCALLIEAAGGPTRMVRCEFEELSLPAGPGAHAALMSATGGCWVGAVLVDGRALTVVAHGPQEVEAFARRALATARLSAQRPTRPSSDDDDDE